MLFIYFLVLSLSLLNELRILNHEYSQEEKKGAKIKIRLTRLSRRRATQPKTKTANEIEIRTTPKQASSLFVDPFYCTDLTIYALAIHLH